MNNTAKHTPGPICTCGIITTVVDTGIGCYDENKIAQCELCAAAHAMYEALKGMMSMYDSLNKADKHVGDCPCYHCKARQAFTQAEGKQS